MNAVTLEIIRVSVEVAIPIAYAIYAMYSEFKNPKKNYLKDKEDGTEQPL